MSKAEAIGVLAKMATKKGLSEEEVVALQCGVTSLKKRMFDNLRSRARKLAREALADEYRTPPEVVALVNPPMVEKKEGAE